MSYATFEEWKYEVDRQFRIRTFCSCVELSVEVEPMKDAYKDGKAPTSFVTRWMKDYGLTDCTEH